MCGRCRSLPWCFASLSCVTKCKGYVLFHWTRRSRAFRLRRTLSLQPQKPTARTGEGVQYDESPTVQITLSGMTPGRGSICHFRIHLQIHRGHCIAHALQKCGHLRGDRRLLPCHYVITRVAETRVRGRGPTGSPPYSKRSKHLRLDDPRLHIPPTVVIQHATSSDLQPRLRHSSDSGRTLGDGERIHGISSTDRVWD
jgi:hypothetical protein